MADILIGNVRGPQGVQGDPGEQGVQGEAATIEVGTVSTTAYGNPAQVTNSGTESEAVLDFVIPAGRPGEETTSMSALTLDTITAQTAAFPVPAVGERGAVVFGKIIKFFTDTVSSLANKLNISDVVNNLTSTATNKPLSAAQGKTLNDAIALEDLTTSITMSTGINYTSRRLLKFRKFVYLQILLPTCPSGTQAICTIPTAGRPSILIALSTSAERGADRTGRASAFVNANGTVYSDRENASSGPVIINGVWRTES